uniref:Transposase n=1 Tax=Candidatus Kentrum sp. MB TaxID=2138164 RepID=A0A450XJW4_9GAMM|nr:MAG: hypothetical protein BECKMB1821G_GA0114241_104412 [Candidatus Kentron sp. MB]VFK29564.1 MAG: hypothetical protein BECKMB1821I_GA0114274_101062 [Candidatus Kentron sp. MB]VFK74834.1 MAG: hypothetical protein BECKMB1821H_GA0114242_101062 [Candidatus Kentron sp. MB]
MPSSVSQTVKRRSERPSPSGHTGRSGSCKWNWTGSKKDLASRLSLEEKRQRIKLAHPGLSIQRQCDLLGLSRASYYRGTTPLVGIETAENLTLMPLLGEEYTRHPFYGNRKMGLVSVVPKPNSSRLAPEHKRYL